MVPCKRSAPLKNFVNSDFRHDPDADGAVVMKAPTKEHAEKFNKKYRDPPAALYQNSYISTRGLPIVPVVLDPVVAKHLRPHQIEGCFSSE